MERIPSRTDSNKAFSFLSSIRPADGSPAETEISEEPIQFEMGYVCVVPYPKLSVVCMAPNFCGLAAPAVCLQLCLSFHCPRQGDCCVFAMRESTDSSSASGRYCPMAPVH